MSLLRQMQIEGVTYTAGNNGIDASTSSLQTLDYSHHEMHEGEHYFIKTWLNITGAGTVAYFMFTTPNTTKWAHARALMTGEAGFQIEIYEGGTVSANGTQVLGVNNNRNSVNTAGLLAYAAPTVTTDGTLIWDAKTGTGRDATGVSPALGYEIIAKQNETYLFKITKDASGTNYLDIDFFWYEHTDKN